MLDLYYLKLIGFLSLPWFVYYFYYHYIVIYKECFKYSNLIENFFCPVIFSLASHYQYVPQFYFIFEKLPRMLHCQLKQCFL